MTDLVIRTRLSISSATSDFCNVGTSTFWYPVAPGTTTLPAPPASTTNASPLPANAVTIPEDFDPTNLCYLFQDLLPVNQGPVFPTVLTPAVNFQPYSEIVPTEGVTYTSLTITEYPYALTLPTGTIELPTKAGLTYVIPITGEAGSFALTGQDASLKRGYRLVGSVGSFALTGQNAGSLRNYIFAGGAGSFTVTGQNAGTLYGRLPLAGDVGSFTLTGQDAALFEIIGLQAEAGSYTLTGQNATLSPQDRIVTGNAGAFTLAGQNAPYSSVLSYTAIPNDGNPSATSFTIAKPTGTASGDYLVAFIMHRTQEPTAPSGWTKFATSSQLSGSGITAQWVSVYSKTAGASEPTNYTWSYPSTSQRITGTILRTVGVALSDFQSTSLVAPGSAASMPSVTKSQANIAIYGAHSIIANTNASTFTYTGTQGDIAVLDFNAVVGARLSIAYAKTADITSVSNDVLVPSETSAFCGFRVVLT